MNCITLKKCSKCGEEKEFTHEYFPKRTNPTGLRKECRKCWRKKANAYMKSKRAVKRTNPICVMCKKEFEGRTDCKYCSDECRKERDCLKALYKALLHYIPKQSTCKECGEVYNTQYGDKKREDYCSITCSNRYNKRVSKSLRRAKIKGNKYERINPIDIFKRDNWICQMCGVNTPYELRGTYEDDAPELDHVIPIALGGEHTEKNVQCSCRKCNQSKGATIMSNDVKICSSMS